MKEKKEVLVIEDEQALSEAVRIALESKGYKTVIKSNGRDGVEYAVKFHPDLILLDQNMPVMDGNTALHYLRQDRWGKDARVIVMTNVNDVTTMNTSLGLGVTDYVLKSEMELSRVIDMVEKKIADSTKANEASTAHSS